MTTHEHIPGLGSWSDLLNDRLPAVLSQEGLWIAAGPSCERLLGWRSDELLGHSLATFVHPEDRGTITSLTHGSGPVSIDHRLRHKAGGYRVVRWRAVREADRIRALGQVLPPHGGPTSEDRPEGELRTALHEQSALLQATLENMDQGLVMFDADQRIHVYNKRALELLDLPEQLMEQRPTLRRLIEHQLASNDFARSTEAFRRWVVDSGVRVARDVYERVRPDGTVLEIRTVPLAGGGAVRTYTDITARRKAEREQHASEERCRAVIATGTAILWRAAPDGQITHEDGWRSYTGQSSAEALGQGWLERVHTADRAWVLDQWLSIVASRTPGALEYRVVRADGAVRWVQARAVPLIDAEGEIREWVGTLTDIDEQRTAQETLAESEARYRLLTESLTDMVVRADQTGLRLYVSPASREILGYEPEELVGTRAAQFTHPDDLPALQMKLAAIGRGEIERTTMNYRLRHKMGHWVPIEASFRVVRSPTGVPEGIISVSRDISARRRLEAQFQQAQKMEAMGQLTGGIAHDFNNLLTVVMGNAELLLEEPSNPAMTRDLAQMILDTAEKGAELASRLLAFGRRQSLKPQRMDLEEVVRSMMPLIRRSTGEHIELQTDFGTGGLLALTDRALLESAILNLVVNARDAMPQSGRLTIQTGRRLAVPSEGPLPSGQPVVFLTVSDTGTGMTPEVLARAFEPFFTTKEVGQGTGLGLSMVYGFAQQSGGHVQIETREGLGTDVTLVLPGVTGTVAAAVAVPSRGPSPRAEKERVLLVEDEPKVLQFALSQLENLGYDVTAVTNGPEALDLLGQGGTYDLLFSDVVLPKGMSGVELARRARELRPDLKILLTSGYSEEAFQHHGRPEQGTILLKKPYRRKELAEVIRKVLGA
jgi:PAS domain S-box-containing protein